MKQSPHGLRVSGALILLSFILILVFWTPVHADQLETALAKLDAANTVGANAYSASEDDYDDMEEAYDEINGFLSQSPPNTGLANLAWEHDTSDGVSFVTGLTNFKNHTDVMAAAEGDVESAWLDVLNIDNNYLPEALTAASDRWQAFQDVIDDYDDILAALTTLAMWETLVGDLGSQSVQTQMMNAENGKATAQQAQEEAMMFVMVLMGF